jgi:TRAP-type C4-dicarboxylate transport system permease small subunit
MIGMLFTILIYIVVLGILWFAIDYAINNVPIPDPPARFIRIIVVVFFCIILVALLLNMTGVQTGVNLPRIG